MDEAKALAADLMSVNGKVFTKSTSCLGEHPTTYALTEVNACSLMGGETLIS